LTGKITKAGFIMKSITTVNFETFYFFELLETIQKNGASKYDHHSTNYLDKLIDYLKNEKTAQESIEKLAISPATSDLAIFFSDILDQLHNLSLDDSIEKLPGYAGDFLEIFDVFLENEEWKSAIARDIEAGEVLEEPEIELSEIQEDLLSLEEYCRQVIKNKMTAASEDLPLEMQEAYQEYLSTLQTQPNILEKLGERFPEDRVAEFVKIHEQILQDHPEAGLDDFMDTFEEKVEKWTNLFRDFLLDHFTDAEALFHPESVTPSEEVEQPFEELFEQTEEEIQFAEEESAEPASEELEMLAEELDRRKPRPRPSLTEEEKARRKFLRDYVVNEVNSFAEEVLSAVDRLVEIPANEEALTQLSENLKGLKDLGQIHAYPGIEKPADQLLQVVNRSNDEGKSFTSEEKSILQLLFELMPDYIDSTIADDDSHLLRKIEQEISRLRSQLFMEETTVDIQAAEVLEGGLQDVVSRYAKIIDVEIASGVNADTPEKLAPVFNDLLYWSELLLQNKVFETVKCVQELLTPDRHHQLTQENKQLISDVVRTWASSYVSESPEVWDNYYQQLSDMYREEEVRDREDISIADAIQAFQDVTLRQLREFVQDLRITSADIQEITSEHLPGLFQALQENSYLLQNDDLEILFRMLGIKLNNFDAQAVHEPKRLKKDLINLLGKIEAEIHSLPDEVRTAELLRQFDELLRQAVVEPEAVEVQSEEREAAAPEEEILEVFKLEALNCINELQDCIIKLQKAPNDKDTWHEMGIQTHTLKGSAQMVGREDVARLADPLNRAIELAGSEQLPVQADLLSILESYISILGECIEGREVDTATELDKVNNYIAQFELQEEAAEEPETSLEEGEAEEAIEEELTAETPELLEEGVEEKAEVPVEEAIDEALEEPVETRFEKEIPLEAPAGEDMIFLEERDPELLEIFQSEVSNNFDIVERNLANLEKFSYDREAIQQGERAVHEIRAAAKMLGIGEVSSLADKLENIFELLILHKVEDFDKVIPVTRRAMLVIRELTTKHSVRKNLYDEVLENLNRIIEAPEDIKITISSESYTGETESPETEVVEEVEESVAEVSIEETTDITPQVMELYIQESREQLEDIDYILLKLEKTSGDEDMQNQLMRSMHTLKGSSGMVYAHKIEKLSHRAEDILEKSIKNQQELPPDLFNLMFAVVDEIKLLLTEIEENGTETGRNYQELLDKLNELYQEVAVSMPVEAKEITFAEAEEAEEAEEELVTIGKKKEAKISGAKDTYLRLNINKMNHLLNLAAELVISNNQFKTQLDRIKNFIPLLNTNLKVFRDTEDYLNTIVREGKHLQEAINPLVENKPGTKESLKKQVDSIQRVLKNVKNMQDEITSITHLIKENSKTYDENQEKLTKLSNELLDDIMQARLVPINILFQRFHRPIRDLAHQLQKQIRVSISGEDTELDRILVDELHEPLLHLIRNAIDHGLETTQERKSLGKDSEGLLEIKASRDRNQVIIEISDDGRGIDMDNVKKTAVKRGLLTKADAKHMSEQELFEYLFYPGFSTAKETTLVSGRGVGLDAVKAQIEKAKGDIRTYTEKGKGTTFNIRVPISLSVIQSMLIEVSGHLYSVPLMQVEETLHVNGQDLLAKDDKYYITYREKKIPVVQLNQLLKIRDIQINPISPEANYPVIMVQDEGNRVALLVDKIIRREEILIKSLGPGLRRLRYISGGSIMVDGQVVLVLDIPQIIQDIVKGIKPPVIAEVPASEVLLKETKVSKAAAPPQRQKKIIKERKPVALIVDDSLSIRKYLSSLLMQKGFVTETARNGYEALELLNKKEFDIMVTDLEMPKLSGYELIETLRYDQRFLAFPIIVLTGRAGENFRQLTAELGADAYIIKPFKDRELFEQIEKFVEYQA
jgi:chemosensory pili system protein ChpA (sensor histidine kinase/response regulator)